MVTASDREGAPVGLTATSVCSVSLEPPLVLVCIGASSRTHEAIVVNGRYAINVLGAGNRSISERFAGSGPDKFDGLSWESGRQGLPLLSDAIAACECEVEQAVPAGDHTIFISRVLSASANEHTGSGPLLWYRGAHRRLAGDDAE